MKVHSMSWYRKLLQSDRLEIAGELAQHIFRQMNPQPISLAEVLRQYPSLGHSPYLVTVDKILEVVATEGRELLEIASQFQGSSAVEKVKKLIEFTTFQEKIAPLSQKLEKEVPKIHEFLRSSPEDLQNTSSEVKQKISEIHRKVELLEKSWRDNWEKLERDGEFTFLQALDLLEELLNQYIQLPYQFQNAPQLITQITSLLSDFQDGKKTIPLQANQFWEAARSKIFDTLPPKGKVEVAPLAKPKRQEDLSPGEVHTSPREEEGEKGKKKKKKGESSKIRLDWDPSSGDTVKTADQSQEISTRDLNLPSPRENSIHSLAPDLRLPDVFQAKGEKSYTCGEISHSVHRFVHLPTGMDFVLIPGGKYTVQGQDLPPKKVTLETFLISRYPVTQKVWVAMTGFNPSNFRGPDHPVDCISWKDAVEFCQKVKLRLPSEVEWEVACRAGSKTPHFWGKGKGDAYCWYEGNSEGQTHPIAHKKPNAFGLYDTLGNVSEWCRDAYQDQYPTGSFNPLVDSDEHLAQGARRVFRGGSFEDSLEKCRADWRSSYAPEYRWWNYGLRLACSLA